MIRFSNGHSFKYMTASGALAYDGRGWPWEKPLVLSGLIDPTQFTHVTKTITIKPRKGNLRYWNPFGTIRFLNGYGDTSYLDTFVWTNGVVNAVGLRNNGFDWWINRHGRHIRRNGLNIVLSISGEPEELRRMTLGISDIGLVGIEINMSCPNIEGGAEMDAKKIIAACRAVSMSTSLPIILKASAIQKPEAFIPQVERSIEAISINSVPWDLAFPEIRSPLKRYGGGGVSGKAAQKYNWDFAERISRITSVPVIWPSVWSKKDFLELKRLEVPAISFGSVFLRYPMRPTRLIRKYGEMETPNPVPKS